MVLPPMGLTLVSLPLPTGNDQVGWVKALAMSVKDIWSPTYHKSVFSLNC